MKKITKYTIVTMVALLALAASALAIFFVTLPIEYKGFTTMQEGNTQLRVLSIQNVINSATKITSRVTINNPSAVPISFNATIEFSDISDNILTNYTISDSLNAGQQKTWTKVVTPINVTAWYNTTVDITATA